MAEEKNKLHELTAEGKIHVMPEFFRPAVAKAMAGKSAVVSIGKDSKAKRIKPLYIVVAVLLVGMFGGSVYLLYLSTKPVITPAPVVVPQPAQAPVVEQPAPVVEPVPEVAPEAKPIVEPFKPEKLAEAALTENAGVDSDKDGLTDGEEMLFGTNKNKEDSDKDGYIDGTEVLNLYNPQGTAPVKLEFTNFVKVYTNDSAKYSFFYPEEWTIEPSAVNDNEVVLRSAGDEFINIFTVKKDAAQSLQDWYLAMVPTLTIDKIEKINSNKNKLEGVVSPDEYTYYFAQNDLIYVVHYNVGKDLAVNYPTVLKMIANSFNLGF
ncbi:hypothetical protein HY932_03215 [Candidatus Falkowbacteria bacterium]|nr:hypothetical protein [Candidatus Falkowbacteria bacterium]